MLGDGKCQILLISGSLRAGSSNASALKTVQAIAPQAVHVTIYEGLDALPHFNPDLEQTALPDAVRALRAQLNAADAVMFSTPEYAGALPGSFKNLLDWSVGEGLHAKPVGFINVSPHEDGAQHAYASLRTVLGYLGCDLVEAACVRAAVRRDLVDAQGLVTDEDAKQTLRDALLALVARARSRAD
jgi:chromate reductase